MTIVAKRLAPVAFGLIFMAGAAMADAGGEGAVVLYGADNLAPVSQALAACDVVRKGTIGGANGPFKVGAADRFAVATCPPGYLGTHLDKIATAADTAGAGRVMTGEFSSLRTASGGADAAYIMKLSYFDTAKTAEDRQEALNQLNTDAFGRDGAWTIDASLQVEYAVGLEAPDSIDVIYYESPEVGADFRKNNGDIMGRVGAFNKTFVTTYTYLFGALSDG